MKNKNLIRKKTKKIVYDIDSWLTKRKSGFILYIKIYQIPSLFRYPTDSQLVKNYWICPTVDFFFGQSTRASARWQIFANNFNYETTGLRHKKHNGLWLLLWRNGHFLHQRIRVWIQSSAKSKYLSCYVGIIIAKMFY